MDPHEKKCTPTDRGATGFNTIAIVFAGVLAALVLAGVWATTNIGEDTGPPPTTTTPK